MINKGNSFFKFTLFLDFQALQNWWLELSRNSSQGMAQVFIISKLIVINLRQKTKTKGVVIIWWF